jgi:uncharacterized protein DUF6338
VSAPDIEATIRYLVPGFIALKVFYLFGLRTRRSDFGWTVLSIATAAILDSIVGLLGVQGRAERLLVATGLGVLLAVLAGLLWQEISSRSDVAMWFARQAWDKAFARPGWRQVWIEDGPIVLGAPTLVSESAETDDQDVYLEKPQWVDRTTGERTPVDNVAGMWIPASRIELIQVLDLTAQEPVAPGE